METRSSFSESQRHYVQDMDVLIVVFRSSCDFIQENLENFSDILLRIEVEGMIMNQRYLVLRARRNPEGSIEVLCLFNHVMKIRNWFKRGGVQPISDGN